MPITQAEADKLSDMMYDIDDAAYTQGFERVARGNLGLSLTTQKKRREFNAYLATLTEEEK